MALPYLADFTSKYRGQLIIATYRKWLKSGDQVLDIGCGNGVVSKIIADTLSIKLIGCDILEYPKTYIQVKLMSNPEKLSFPSHTFSSAMFNDVLHHMPYQTQVKLIREALRVAKQILIFEVKPNPLSALSDWLINKIHHPQMNIPFTFRSQQDWEKLFKNLGANYQSTQIKTPLWYPFSHVAFNLN